MAQPCECEAFPCSGRRDGPCPDGATLQADRCRWRIGSRGQPVLVSRQCKGCKAASDAWSHERHREKRLARMREYDQRSQPERRERLSSRTEEEREAQRAYNQEYRSDPVVQRRLRSARLQKAYGITVDDFDRMLAEQGGRCAICRRTKEEAGGRGEHLHVDHDHETGRVRGLLCHACNTRLHRTTDLVWFRAAIAYLTDRG